MNIVDIIHTDAPTFEGICIRDGSLSPEKIRELGLSMAWTFHKGRASKCKKVLITGTGEHKGKYFIADVTGVETVRDSYNSQNKKWKEAILYNDELFDNWISLHLNSNKPNNPVDDRLIIAFENPTEIKHFSTDFTFDRTSFYYINPKIGNNISDKVAEKNAPLSHLKSLYIKGFKDANREVFISFCDESISVIHGENGCGKTTFLKVIQAILKKDIAYLKQEKIAEFKLTFLQGEQEHVLSASLQDISEGFAEYNVDMPEVYEILEKYSHSVFFGVHRGVEDNMQEIRTKLLQIRYLQEALRGESVGILDELIKKIPSKDSILSEDFLKENHIAMENLSIDVVGDALRYAFDKAKTTILRGMNEAFLQTIDSVWNTDYENMVIPVDFEARFKVKKAFFQLFLQELKPSTSQEKLKKFIEVNDLNLIEQEKPLFKSLIMNLLIQAEKDGDNDIELQAINSVINTFNDFLIKGKKMELGAVKTYIVFPDQQTHTLKELSSGEKHLLSFLTLFLILRRNNNLFLIDEPEISLSMIWQRKLLPLLREFAPHAQIIAATHSPSIVKNTNYLVELPI